MPFETVAAIKAGISKRRFNPHIRLTNMSTAYYQDMNNRPAKTLFPIVPVQLSTASYYEFSKEDLLRDDVQKKPQYGTVAPFIVSHTTGVYECDVYQAKTAIDLIEDTDYSRTNAPGSIRAQNSKARVLAEKMAIHQDNDFGRAYFRSGVWSTELSGVDNTSPTSKQFIKFSNDNSDPIKFFRAQATAMKKQTGRKPNKLGLGANTYDALSNHPAILERIDGAASTQNPAMVSETVLATLLGFEKVVVFDAIQNKAGVAADADMDFICDPNAALMVYAPSAAAIDIPSAGYIFTWDMLGNGQFLPIIMDQGPFGTFTDEILGMMAYDMKKVADDLGVFLKDCV